MAHLQLPGMGANRLDTGAEQPGPEPRPLPPVTTPLPPEAPPPIPYPTQPPSPGVPGARTWLQAHPWIVPTAGGSLLALIIGLSIGAAVGRRQRRPAL